MHLLDKVYNIIVDTKPTYNDNTVLVQKGRLLDMKPEQLVGYSNELMVGLFAQGGMTPTNSLGTSLLYNSPFFEIAARGLKKQSEQELGTWLTNLLKRFIDYSDDVIIDIRATSEVDKVGWDQQGNLEVSCTIIVNTINLHNEYDIAILVSETQMTIKNPKIGGEINGTINRSLKPSVQRSKVSNNGAKSR